MTVEVLDNPEYGPRMNALLVHALARTGGATQEEDWAAIMRLCADVPHRSRVVGLFAGESRAPDSLLGFAWGIHHGDRVEYHIGASARVPDVKIRILSPVLWDLITWGRRTGGQWFDLGGITPGSAGSEDPLGGISDFKRGFSKVETLLGEEFALEPSPFRWRLASLNSRAMSWVRTRVKRARSSS
ncbi:MAG TPA: hypothetical protein VFZ73_00060 [Gemmatimonadaceae bacterium]